MEAASSRASAINMVAPGGIFRACGPLERGGVFRRHCRFLAREQVFDSEYLKAGEFPERRIKHARTGSFLFHRGRGIREQALG